MNNVKMKLPNSFHLHYHPKRIKILRHKFKQEQNLCIAWSTRRRRRRRRRRQCESGCLSHCKSILLRK
jgi:hypothetical protein